MGLDKAEKYADELADAREKLEGLFGDISSAWDKTMEVARDYSSKGGRNNINNKGWDSLSTVFMKALGYEGVDTRGLSDYDNVNYGSVIYNLRDEDGN